MTPWPTKKLGEVCEIISPGIEKFNGIKKYVATADVDFDKIVNFSEITYSNRPSRANMEPKENDVLVARMAETQKFLVIDKKLQDDYIFSTGFAVLRTKKDLLPKYLFYSFTTRDFNLQKNKLAVGATQKAINNPALKRIKIPIPPLPIQQKIVERLDAIKKAQELNDKQIAFADELFQSLLHRELDPRGKRWKVKKLGELSLVITKGTTPTTYGYQFTNSGIPFLRVEDINNNLVNPRLTEYYISKETHEFLKRSKTKPKDVLITIAGTIGKVAYVPEDAPEMNMNQAVAIVRLKSTVSHLFIFYLLQTKMLQRAMRFGEVTGTVTNISLTTLKNLKIPLLPLETQKKIVEKLSAVQEYKKKLLKQKQLLQELFESVLNKSFKITRHEDEKNQEKA